MGDISLGIDDDGVDVEIFIEMALENAKLREEAKQLVDEVKQLRKRKFDEYSPTSANKQARMTCEHHRLYKKQDAW